MRKKNLALLSLIGLFMTCPLANFAQLAKQPKKVMQMNRIRPSIKLTFILDTLWKQVY